jgi:hypothetical protein
MTTLLPCPFCNGQPRTRQVQADEWVIECISPLLPLCAANIGQQNGLDKAVFAWNRRAHDAAETAAIQKVRDEMAVAANMFHSWERVKRPYDAAEIVARQVAALDAILEARR